MIWATRRLARDEVPSIDKLFRDQVSAVGTEGRMLLVGVDEDWPMTRLWVAVPEPDLLSAYYGFALCLRSDLPLAPTLVAGRADEFERIFHGAGR